MATDEFPVRKDHRVASVGFRNDKPIIWLMVVCSMRVILLAAAAKANITLSIRAEEGASSAAARVPQQPTIIRC